MSLNKVELIGFVAREPEVKECNGAKVASFTLATRERYKDKNGEFNENTEWHSIVCWRQTAEYVEKYISKGALLYIDGKLRTRSWDDNNGTKRYVTEIMVNSLQSLDRKQSQNQQPEHQKFDPHAAPTTPLQTEDDAPEDDLPF